MLHSIQIERRLGVDGIAGHAIGQIVLGIAIDLVLLAIRQAARWLHMHNKRNELEPIRQAARAT